MTDFDMMAVTAAMEGRQLGSFAQLSPGDPVPLDIDYYAPGKAVVWLVQLHPDGSCISGTVYLDRADGAWEAGESNSETWAGWIELATERPTEAWPDWGPILGLGVEQGYGVPGEGHSTARGVAAGQVVSIEFGVADHSRTRGIDSPTGAFIIAVPQPLMDKTPVLKVTLVGGTVMDLNR